MAVSTRKSQPVFLAVYLNDHLGGSFAGVELIRRLARTHRGSSPGDVLQRLANEIDQDRTALLKTMAALDIRPRRYKGWLAWLGEKVGRPKPNGRLLKQSPLSNLLELEAMRLGVEGKGAGWRTLQVVAEHDPRLDSNQLDDLLARARRQADTLEELRLRAATDLLGSRP